MEEDEAGFAGVAGSVNGRARPGRGRRSAVSSVGDGSMESVDDAMGRQAELFGITMLSNRLS